MSDRRPEPGEPIRSITEVEVRYAETDQMGIVHHANYLVWFELARTRLCLSSGHHYADVEKRGYRLVVTRTESRYRRGARYGDTVQVSCWLERLSSRGLRFAYDVHRDGELLASGATEHVWVDAARNRPCRIPPFLQAPFARLAGHASGP